MSQPLRRRMVHADCEPVREGELSALADRVSAALGRGQLQPAAVDADAYAGLRWGTPDRRIELNGRLRSPLQGVEPATRAKLRHDLEQFNYLHRIGVMEAAFEGAAGYRAVIARLADQGLTGRSPLTEKETGEIGHLYSRLLHVRPTPRVARALSDGWCGPEAEAAYFAHPLGVVVIDDFLSPEALDALRRFCLESTIWSTSRYSHGRLGAFFRDGFNCPLLIQIAEELPAAMPNLIGIHPLRQLWAFKYASTHPGNSAHADFAAVNVNFWITADEANLDDRSGGLLIYDVEAPMDWSFMTYNKDAGAIRRFLQARRASAIRVPYRANRAIIFNSDLFHTTDAVEFRPGYENRRVNVTFLYGDRKADRHPMPGNP